MYGRLRLRRLVDACLILTPYIIAFMLNRSVIADAFSLVLFAFAIWFLKTPVRILRIAYKVQGTQDVVGGIRKGRWKVWWLSPPALGTISYLYFILVKNHTFSFPEVIGLPELGTILVVVFWWAIILIFSAVLMQSCRKEYLANVFHIGNSTIRRTKTQVSLVKEIGFAEFQKYERVQVSFSLVLGLFALLPCIFFVGGGFILDSLALALVLYSMLFDPNGPFHDFEKLFYARLLSDLRERHRLSFMVSLLVLLALVGNDIIFLDIGQLIPLLVKMISLLSAFLFFFKVERFGRIRRIFPYLASFWIFLTYFLGNQNSALATALCLFPLMCYFIFSAIQVGIEDTRHSTAGKLAAYLVLYVATSFTSTILLFVATRSFVYMAFLTFAHCLVLSVGDKLMSSKEALAQTKFKDVILAQETRISSVSVVALLILVTAYFYFFFARSYEMMIGNFLVPQMLPRVFLNIALTIFMLPFVLLGYFYLFPPCARYTLTTSELLCHMGIIRARIPLNTITSFEKETRLKRITHRVPFLIRPGTIVNCCGPFAWNKKIRHDQIVIFASESFTRHLQEASYSARARRPKR